jgi:hypothetical protein
MLEVVELQKELQAVELQKQLQAVERKHALELQRLTFDLESKREASKTDISVIFAKFFVVFVSLCAVFIFIGAISSGFGAPIEWKEAAASIIEIIKIAVLPIAMLVLGFHFGGAATNFGPLKGLSKRTSGEDK